MVIMAGNYTKGMPCHVMHALLSTGTKDELEKGWEALGGSRDGQKRVLSPKKAEPEPEGRAEPRHPWTTGQQMFIWVFYMAKRQV
jgi:hypothetical protein